MDIAYLHIITNHIPIIGVPFALFVLILGIWRKSDELKAVSFLIFVLLGIATLGVFLLGQGGEDFVEELAGVSHDAIEDHEDFAKFALATVGVLAVFSAFGLIYYKGFQVLKRKSSDKLLNGQVDTSTNSYFPNWLVYSILTLTLLSSGILGYTGKLGGKIRHTEFYGDATVNTDEDDKREERENAEPDRADEVEKDGGKGRGRGRNRGGR